MSGAGSRPSLDWAAIKDANPIADIIGQAISLTKAGNEYKACCPFHADKSPSFHVIPAKGFAHCFGCGWSGDVVDFVAAYKNCSVSDALGMLAGDKVGDQDPAAIAARKAAQEQREAAAAKARQAAINKARAAWEAAGPADPHHPYLVRKGIEPHTARQHHDGRLLLPIFDSEGDVQSVQYIDDAGRKLFEFNAPTSHGRMHIGINMGRTILCEGFATGADIFAAVPDQVCVTFSMNNMEKVAREYHAAGRAIVLAADTGACAERMTALAVELSCPVVIPSVPTDFNDMRQALGQDAVADAFHKALRAFAEFHAVRENAPAVESGPVDIWAAPPVPELPRGLLPPLIEQFAFESSAQMGTDPAGFAMSALAACAACIHDDIALQPKLHEKWSESARIWTMLIGAPSARKSPMMNRTTSAIKRRDAAMLRANARALAQWQDDGGNKGSTPKPPQPRLRIEDTTTESAQEVCRESPAGIMVLQDELSGFFGRIEKYGGGKGGSADRSFWLQAYGGGQYAVNRVGRGSFIIDNLSVTILGGIQPEAIREVMATATDDGLIQRFIPVVLRKAARDRDVEAPPVADRFGDLLERLLDLAPPSNFFGTQPLRFSPGARDIREALADKHHRIVQGIEDYNPKLSTHIGKYDGLFVRLCVIWHCVENIHHDMPLEVTEATASRVAAFLSDFIMGHAMAFYVGTIGLAAHDEIIRAVGGSILAHALETVTARDLTRKVRAFRMADPIAREHVLQTLEAFGWLERYQVRSDAPAWRVSPEVHAKFAEKARSERVRRAEIVEIIAETARDKRAEKEA